MSLLDKVPGELKLYIGGCVNFEFLYIACLGEIKKGNQCRRGVEIQGNTIYVVDGVLTLL